MTRKKHFLLLALLFMALVPLMCLRDFTPDNELRYLSIADEALREGHFFAFTSHGAPYADKPPLYLWIVMLCRAVAGRHLLPLLGLFSLLPALGVLRAMDRWVGVRMGRPRRPGGDVDARLERLFSRCGRRAADGYAHVSVHRARAAGLLAQV